MVSASVAVLPKHWSPTTSGKVPAAPGGPEMVPAVGGGGDVMPLEAWPLSVMVAAGYPVVVTVYVLETPVRRWRSLGS